MFNFLPAIISLSSRVHDGKSHIITAKGRTLMTFQKIGGTRQKRNHNTNIFKAGFSFISLPPLHQVPPRTPVSADGGKGIFVAHKIRC